MIKYTEEEIVKYSNYSVKELVDGGICPTCFNKCSGGKVYGSNENLLTLDGIHLNEFGNKIFFDEIFSFLKQLL